MKVIPDPTDPGQESVWSSPRPAVAEPSQRSLEIVARHACGAATEFRRHTAKFSAAANVAHAR